MSTNFQKIWLCWLKETRIEYAIIFNRSAYSHFIILIDWTTVYIIQTYLIIFSKWSDCFVQFLSVHFIFFFYSSKEGKDNLWDNWQSFVYVLWRFFFSIHLARLESMLTFFLFFHFCITLYCNVQVLSEFDWTLLEVSIQDIAIQWINIELRLWQYITLV